eukprot:4083569-Alexandrium_andersonii.AAC.1
MDHGLHLDSEGELHDVSSRDVSPDGSEGRHDIHAATAVGALAVRHRPAPVPDVGRGVAAPA